MSRQNNPVVKAGIAKARTAIVKKKGRKKGMDKEARTLRQLRIADVAYNLANSGERVTYTKIGRILKLSPITVAQSMKSQSFEDLTKCMGMDDFSVAAVLSNHIYNKDANISIKAIQERNKMVGAYKNVTINLEMPEEIRMMKQILDPEMIEGELVEEDEEEL